MTNKVVYQYADGSGNVYALRGKDLSYNPVTPAESSTGTYSGGVPKTVSLTSLQAETVIRLIEKGMNAADEQSESRDKGTGVIAIESGNKKRECNLRMDSKAKEDIELLLKGYLNER